MSLISMTGAHRAYQKSKLTLLSAALAFTGVTSAPATLGAAGNMLEEITVTARKKDESIQDVP
ncbi:MAG: hypothetical protein VW840_03515, partial [Gammaproteobacteria bacterium]